jgi:ubiquinone/menaquinone biosynthesis C-methylase UbiE
MLQHARKNNPEADLQQGFVDELPYPNASFDRVTCIEVLRYLPDPTPCLYEMSRVLRPGGVALATAAPLFALNGYAIINRIALRFPQLGLTRLKQFFTTSRRLRAQFRAAGFAEVTIHGVYVGPVVWVTRAMPRLAPQVLRAWQPLDEHLADLPLLRELSNMYLVRAVRSGHV